MLLVLTSFSLSAQEVEVVEIEDETPTSTDATPVINDSSTEVKPPTEEFVPAPAPHEEETPASAPVEAQPPAAEFVPAATVEDSKMAADKAEADERETDEKEFYYERKSRWVTTFGFENTKYPTIFTFEGRKDFKPDDKELWGGRAGFGGEIYLGAGFVTRSMIEGYYLGTLFSRVLNGGDEAADVEFAFTKQTGQILGGDASQSLGWMFNFRTKNPFMETWSYMTLEPFVEAGIGKAWAYNRLNYSYDTGTTPTSAQEQYRLRVRDDLLTARVGAGIQLASRKGFFLTLKATVNRYEVTQRKIQGFSQPNGAGVTDRSSDPKDVKIDPIVIYHLGGGYKF